MCQTQTATRWRFLLLHASLTDASRATVRLFEPTVERRGQSVSPLFSFPFILFFCMLQKLVYSASRRPFMLLLLSHQRSLELR